MAKKKIIPQVKLGIRFSEKLVPTVAVDCHINKKEPLIEYLRRSKSAGS